MENKIIEETVTKNNGESTLVFRNNKKLIILFVSAVVLVALIVVGVSFVVPKSIAGSWELTENPEVAQATADEISDADRVYYVFEKPNRYGKGEWYICYDGGVEYYEYGFLEEDSIEKINLGSENLEYKITGSKLLGTAKITLFYPEYTDESTGATYEAQEYVLEQARAPKYEKESYKNYEVDEELVGEWVSNERILSYYYYSFSYVETVTIMDNGVMVIHYESEDLGLDRYMYYAYTAEGSVLTFGLVTDKETRYSIAYEFDENGNLKFTGDNTEASIFADAFFGDYTFYTPDNLPEATKPSNEELFTTP